MVILQSYVFVWANQLLNCFEEIITLPVRVCDVIRIISASPRLSVVDSYSWIGRIVKKMFWCCFTYFKSKYIKLLTEKKILQLITNAIDSWQSNLIKLTYKVFNLQLILVISLHSMAAIKLRSHLVILWMVSLVFMSRADLEILYHCDGV